MARKTAAKGSTLPSLSADDRNLLEKLWLPALLIVIFVFQSHLFNLLTGLSQQYWLRRTLASLGTGALLFLPALWWARKRWRYLYWGSVTLLVTIIYMAQFLYFKHFGTFIQASALSYVGQTTALGSTVTSLAGPSLVLFGLGLALVLVDFARSRKRPTVLLTKQQKIGLAGLILGLLLVGQGFLMVQELRRWGTIGRLYRRAFDNADVVRKMGIINYSLLDAGKQIFKKRGINTADIALVQQWVATRPGPPQNPRHHGIAKGRNVIFVQLESVEGWVLDKKIDGQEITPNLNKLAKAGLQFSNYYPNVGPGTTADAEFITLTALHPPMTEVPFFEYPTHDYLALPEYLKNQGYKATAVMHGDEKTFWNRTAIYPSLGIDQFVGIESYQVLRKVIWGLDDAEFFKQSVPKLQQLPQPFFVNLMALTSHTPFNLPDDLKTLKLKTNAISDFQLNYIQSVHFVDRALGELVQKLKQAGLYESSVLVIFGDHTAQIVPQHDKDFARFEGAGDSYDDWEYLQHLRGPMVIAVPGTELREEVSAVGSHLDLYPTLMNLLGLPTPASVLGQDMLNTSAPVSVRRRTSGAIHSIVTGDLVYFSSENGVYEHGRCLKLPAAKPTEVGQCRAIYDEQVTLIKVSDIVLRGNRLDLLR